jgi:hypothetical protein
MTAGEQTCSGSISSHGLIGLILGSKGMPEGDPAGCEMLVQSIRLVEVLPGEVIFLDQEVVAAHCEPGNGQVRVGRHQLVRQVIKLTYLVQLDEHCTIEGHYVDIVEVCLCHCLHYLIGLGKVLLVEEPLSLDQSQVEAANAQVTSTLL